jgi:HEAT repeat protein
MRIHFALLFLPAMLSMVHAADLRDLDSADVSARIAAAVSAAQAATEGRLGKESVPSLARALTNAYYEVRLHSALALGRLGTPAVPALLVLLRDDFYYGPLFAARAASFLPPDATSKELADQLLKNTGLSGVDQQRQYWAAHALSRMNLTPFGMADRIKAAFQNAPEGDVKQLLGETMARAGALDITMIPDLVNRLDKDPSTKTVLAGFGTNAIPLLTQAIKSPNKKLAWAAIESLGLMGQAAVSAVPALTEQIVTPADQWFAALACETVGKIGPGAKSAVPALIQVLSTHTYEDARTKAAQALGQVDPRSDSTVKALKAALEDKSEPVRKAAEKALATAP